MKKKIFYSEKPLPKVSIASVVTIKADWSIPFTNPFISPISFLDATQKSTILSSPRIHTF